MRCPMCGKMGIRWAIAYDVEYLTNLGPHEYRKCDCGVLYLSDPPQDQLGVIYPSNYYSYSADSRGIPERIKSILDRRILANALRGLEADKIEALDVGGGVGYYSDILRAADLRIATTTIVDIDGSLKSVIESKGHKFINSRIEEVAAERTFDVILALNLIEHVANPKALLNRFRTMLKPNGILIIQTPNFESLDAKLFRNFSWGGLHTPRHWVLFNASSVHNYLNEAGFVVQKIQHIQGAPFWAVSLLSRFPWMRSRSRRLEPMYKSHSYGLAIIIFGAIDLIRSLLGFSTSQLFIIATTRDSDHDARAEHRVGMPL